MSLKNKAAQVRAQGYKNSGEDSILAHITPKEAGLLKMYGGSGRTDPHTGLPHFDEGESGGGGFGGGDGGDVGDGGGGFGNAGWGDAGSWGGAFGDGTGDATKAALYGDEGYGENPLGNSDKANMFGDQSYGPAMSGLQTGAYDFTMDRFDNPTLASMAADATAFGEDISNLAKTNPVVKGLMGLTPATSFLGSALQGPKGMMGLMGGIVGSTFGPIGGLVGSKLGSAFGNSFGNVGEDVGNANTASGGSVGGSDLIQGLAGLYLANRQNGESNKQINGLESLFAPGSPYATQMRQQLERRDAAAGRRSQYGNREVELQAALAQQASRMAPTLNQMYQQKAGNRNLMLSTLLNNKFVGQGLNQAGNYLGNMFDNWMNGPKLGSVASLPDIQGLGDVNMDNISVPDISMPGGW